MKAKPALSNTIYLGLGSNLGNKKDNLEKAIELLKQKITLLKCSSVYESKPFGYKDQEHFYNLVLKAQTSLSPQELLFFTQFVEEKLGRRVTFKNGPRVIDIDILFYLDNNNNHFIVELNDLIIPHPRLHERDTVLTPLKE